MSRAEAFQRLSSQRIAKAQKAIQLIGNLSNRNNYQFEIDEVEQLIKTLEVEIEQLRIKFKIEQPRAAEPEIPSITEDLDNWRIDPRALSWIQWGRDKIIHGRREEALELINQGIQMIKNKETIKEQECECGIDDQGNWSDAVFDRFGCECKEERS